MLVHSLASKYARFVVIVRQIYWTPPFRPLDPPLLKSDDLFFREPRDIGPPLSKILDTPLLHQHGNDWAMIGALSTMVIPIY